MFSTVITAAVLYIATAVDLLVILLLFFAYVVPFAWRYVKAGMASGQLSPACGIPMYLIQSFTVISFVLCCIRLIQKFIQRVEIIIGKREAEEK